MVRGWGERDPIKCTVPPRRQRIYRRINLGNCNISRRNISFFSSFFLFFLFLFFSKQGNVLVDIIQRVFRDFPCRRVFFFFFSPPPTIHRHSLPSTGTMRHILHINFARIAIKTRSRPCILYRYNSDQDGVAVFLPWLPLLDGK